jgi:putative drug exporter of the RND superfamily
MSNDRQSHGSFAHRTARTIRSLSVPIGLFWLVVAALTNAFVPQLERSAKHTTWH